MEEDILKTVQELAQEVDRRLNAANSMEEVRAIQVAFLGKKGSVTALIKNLGTVIQSLRPHIGLELNKLKDSIEGRCAELIREFEAAEEEKKITSRQIDITLPPRMIPIGRIHPLTRTMNELIDVFTGMGFSVYEGPEVETDFYNFEALNHPKDHPARDMHDTFYFSDDILLRTHTSPVQIRVMEKMKPPIFMIGPGVVYRRDTPDLTHSPKFHQVEGLMVDRRITLSDLKGVMNEFVRKIFGAKTKTRLRPSFFPFTEPSGELEIECSSCCGRGCRVCKDSGWLEILGCGMVDPNVFKAVNYDPEQVTGFAFGMGVERIAMLKYNISDIRLFYENDIRFLKQF